MKKYKHLNFSTVCTVFISLLVSCKSGPRVKPATDEFGKLQIEPVTWNKLPEPTSNVGDYEDIYTEAEEVVLDSLIGDFERKTTIQFAVVTLDSTVTSADSVDLWTRHFAREWGVGQKDKNNGVVIGISSGRRRIRIENGIGIEKIFSNEETKQLIDSIIKPRFRGGEYFKGTYDVLVAMMRVLEKRYQDGEVKSKN